MAIITPLHLDFNAVGIYYFAVTVRFKTSYNLGLIQASYRYFNVEYPFLALAGKAPIGFDINFTVIYGLGNIIVIIYYNICEF